MLILSRFAGAAVECQAALLVNPYDVEGVGNAIEQALAMPIDERRGRQSELLNILSQNDLKLWGERFITSLARPVASAPWPQQHRAAIASQGHRI